MGSMIGRRDALRAIPLFSGLSDGDLGEIAELLIERRYPTRTTIFEEGSVGEYMYVIREGHVKISKMSDDGREKILEILGPGTFFGEMALLDKETRSASVKSTCACVLLALSRQDFLALLRRNPDISMQLICELSRRLRETDEEVRGLLFERVEGEGWDTHILSTDDLPEGEFDEESDTLLLRRDELRDMLRREAREYDESFDVRLKRLPYTVVRTGTLTDGPGAPDNENGA